MVNKQRAEQTGTGLSHGLGLIPVIVAGCLLSACQTRVPAEPPAPPPEQSPHVTLAPPAAVPAPAPEARGPARSNRLFELSYAVRPPKKAGAEYWKKLETDIRRLAGVMRAEPPIPDFAPLPHEPRKGKPAKKAKKPQPDRPSVAIDRKRGVLTVRAVADRQRAVADYLRQQRRPAGK